MYTSNLSISLSLCIYIYIYIFLSLSLYIYLSLSLYIYIYNPPLEAGEFLCRDDPIQRNTHMFKVSQAMLRYTDVCTYVSMYAYAHVCMHVCRRPTNVVRHPFRTKPQMG